MGGYRPNRPLPPAPHRNRCRKGPCCSPSLVLLLFDCTAPTKCPPGQYYTAQPAATINFLFYTPAVCGIPIQNAMAACSRKDCLTHNQTVAIGALPSGCIDLKAGERQGIPESVSKLRCSSFDPPKVAYTLFRGKACNDGQGFKKDAVDAMCVTSGVGDELKVEGFTKACAAAAKCTACPEGKYSANDDASTACTAWTTCTATSVATKGNSTKDAVCGEQLRAMLAACPAPN